MIFADGKIQPISATQTYILPIREPRRRPKIGPLNRYYFKTMSHDQSKCAQRSATSLRTSPPGPKLNRQRRRNLRATQSLVKSHAPLRAVNQRSAWAKRISSISADTITDVSVAVLIAHPAHELTCWFIVERQRLSQLPQQPQIQRLPLLSDGHNLRHRLPPSDNLNHLARPGLVDQLAKPGLRISKIDAVHIRHLTK